MKEKLLEIKNLKICYELVGSIAHAVDGISLKVMGGECFGLVGESGSGKSTVAKSILKLLPSNARITDGNILLKNRDITHMNEKQIRSIRWKEVSFITQSAMNALNPVARISDQMIETIRIHASLQRDEILEKGKQLFEMVGLNKNRIFDFPHQFSGGMRQRAIIAMAIALNPSLIIADEPTTALDVIMQAQIINLLRSVLKDSNSSMILITHDISVVAEICQRVGVMYAGSLMEYGDTYNVFNNPFHPYTMGLKGAFPSIKDPKKTLTAIPGSPPSIINPEPGCRFLHRCPFSTKQCKEETPKQVEVAEDHFVSCHNFEHAEEFRSKTKGIFSSQVDYKSRLTLDNINQDVVTVEGLKKWFPIKNDLFQWIMPKSRRAKAYRTVKAVNQVSFKIKKGEILGLAGESGCGKTTTALLLLRLYTPTGGKIFFEKKDIASLKKREVGKFRSQAQIVFQDPYESLNPRFTVGRTVEEPLIVNKIGSKMDRLARVIETLKKVKLMPVETFINKYPHELSGGERQRVGIARAIVMKPALLVADEAVSMLDVSIRAGILSLLRELTDEMKMATLYISHDLSLIGNICDRVAIMYAGQILEMGVSEDVIFSPIHPYTEALLAAVPTPEFSKRRMELSTLRGELPDMTNLPAGCSFRPRCQFAEETCGRDEPPLRKIKDEHFVACHIRGC